MARLAVAVLIALLIAGCQIQGSWTPQPSCPPGQHAVRAHSHQGKVWECAP